MGVSVVYLGYREIPFPTNKDAQGHMVCPKCGERPRMIFDRREEFAVLIIKDQKAFGICGCTPMCATERG